MSIPLKFHLWFRYRQNGLCAVHRTDIMQAPGLLQDQILLQVWCVL